MAEDERNPTDANADAEGKKGKKERGNIFRRLRRSNTRSGELCWAFLVLPAMVGVTVLAFPLVYIYEVIVEMPRVFGNFFSDFFGVFADEWRTGARAVGSAWKAWWQTFTGKHVKKIKVNVDVTVVETGDGQSVFVVEDGGEDGGEEQ